MNQVLWRPSDERAQASLLAAFQARVAPAAHDYDALWRWSTSDLEGFWAAVWDDADVVAGRRYDEVLLDGGMPGSRWFPGARLNYAENLLRHRGGVPALLASAEGRVDRTVSRDELRTMVARAQQGLRELGVREGDRVAGFLPNGVQAVVAMLAAVSLGAVWSSCSPDFGAMGVVDRFGQIRPRVLFAADGYRYGGKVHRLQDKVDAVCAGLPDLEHLVVVNFAEVGLTAAAVPVLRYDDLLANEAAEPSFTQVASEHPLFILYSSGTTGAPKSIVHSHGGTLLQHYKEHRLHVDLQAGRDVLLWFTTCGWMMWNWLVSGLASGVTVVLYDGSPTTPDPGVLWRLAERAGVTAFGTSPKFLAACAQAGVRPSAAADLRSVRSVLSTGSPLSHEQFDWVYDSVGADVHLASISGGTDIIGCFAGGAPTLPVRRGELQCRMLGMAVEAWGAEGRPVTEGRGELVCTRPFPSMPVGFWGDDDGSRYHAAYFSQNPGVWTHGDYIEIRPEGGVVIYGRSDTTLNPGGVRIGTAEIYRALEPVDEVDDAVAVGRPVAGDVEVVLCVKLASGADLDERLGARIRSAIRDATSPRHVPRHLFAVSDIPYTISGKKVEKAVRDIISGEEVHNRDALANPASLDEYATLPFPSRLD